MRLREYLRPDLMVLGLVAGDVRTTIRALVDQLAARSDVGDPARLEAVLVKREFVHTTAMGSGVAIPHAALDELERPVVMIAVAPEGAAFGPPGFDPVRVFFLLLSPRSQAGLHIRLLARIARLVRDPALVPRLSSATSPEALLREIERADAEHV